MRIFAHALSGRKCLMIRKQLLIGILAAMTVALPAVGIYAGSAEASETKAAMKTRCPVIKEPVSTKP